MKPSYAPKYVRAVVCPYCAAQPGQPCRSLQSPYSRGKDHLARIRRAAIRVEADDETG